MTYALDPSQPLPDEIRRVASERLDEAIAYLTDSTEPFAARVHEARKRTKEVRSVLRLVRKPLGASQQRAQVHRLRDAAHRLAPARDAEVARSTLDALDGGATDLAPLRKALDAERDAATGSVAGAGIADEAAAELADLREQIAAWPLESDEWRLIQPGLTRAYRQGRRRMREALADPSDATWHAWRKRVKDHWCHLRLLAPAHPAALDPIAEAAHRLSDALGDDHDLAVFAHSIETADATLSARARDRLDRRLADRRTELRAEAYKLGARLYAPKPKLWTMTLEAWWAASRRVPLDN